MNDIQKPPHMDPMSVAEVHKLLSATMHGPLPRPTMQRIFATLADWAPKMDHGVARQATPTQQAALNRYDCVMESSAAEDYIDSGVALEVMAGLANSLRPHQAAVEELFDGCCTQGELATALLVVIDAKNLDISLIRVIHTKVCERNGWEPS